MGNTVSWTIGDPPALDIASFPGGTRALAVEIIGNGGATRAVGLTPPFSLADLDDGDELWVVMAPRRGVCPTASMATPRAGLLMARAGGGALIAGGTDSDGEPVANAAYYDPARATFVDLGEDVYGDPETGLAGATMTELASGRVVLAGGGAPAYQIFDPISGTFDGARFLAEPRAHHAAAALSDGRLFLAGGCAALAADGTCAPGSALTTTAILEADSGDLIPGPTLARPRIDGHAFVLAGDRVVLIGGTDESGAAVTTSEHIDLGAGTSADIAGPTGDTGALLAAGGLLTAFAPAKGVPAAAAAVIAPRADTAAPVAAGARFRAGATLTALASGRVLVVGGGDASEPALYLPASGQFLGLDMAAADSLPGRDHAAVRLASGAVLIAGGRGGDGRALAGAWIFRPDLAGPFQPGATVVFADSDLREALVPSDPAHAWLESGDSGGGIPAHYIVEASTSEDPTLPSAWAVIAGPTLSTPNLSIRAGADGSVDAGVAILVAFESPERYALITLEAGKLASLRRVDGADVEEVSGCTATLITGDAITAEPVPPALAVSFAGDSLAVTVDGERVLSCPSVTSVARGLVGVGAVGTAADRVRIDSILVSR